MKKIIKLKIQAFPLPSEHSGRLVDPSRFEPDSFRRKNITKGIDVILGKLKGTTSMVIQTYRFKKDMFTEAEAKKWLKDHNVKYKSFEKAEGTPTQAFQCPVIFSEKRIQAFTQEDILKRIPENILNEIKQKDAHPFFQMYSLCHEGTFMPTIIGEKPKPITWTKKAIQSIKNILTKGVKLFKGHNKDNSTNNRMELGEVIHSYEEEIEGKLHHLIITYHDEKQKDEAIKNDIISQEADWNFFEQTGQLFADTIDKLTGIAMGNSAFEKPAFSGAKRMALIQAFENNNINTKENIMSDDIIVEVGDAPAKTKTGRQISFQEWIDLKPQFNVYPRQLVNLDELKSDRVFGKYFEELDVLKEENTILKKKIQETEEFYKTELKNLNRKIYVGSASQRLNKIIELNNYPDKMKQFLVKSFETNKEKIEDLTDDGLQNFVRNQTETFQNVMSLVDEPIVQTQTQQQRTEEEVDKNKNLNDFTKAENNEFLAEDLDEELTSSFDEE